MGIRPRCLSLLLPLAAALAAVALAAVALAAPARGDDFPPITDAERTLSAVPGEPGAPAVVLFERGDLDLRDVRSEASSRLEVAIRVKVLTDEGKSFADLAIPHSSQTRLSDFAARTVLADGRIETLGEDDIFSEVSSARGKVWVTKATFPAVEVGAILDYRFVLHWDSILYLEPWFFHNRIPTLLSEIVYHKPDNMSFKPWARQTDHGRLQSSSEREPGGQLIRAWMENLRAVPDEPYSLPFETLSSAIMIVPKEMAFNSASIITLFDTWKSACRVVEEYGYGGARRKSRRAKKKARALTAGIGAQQERAAALYRFVRDEVDTLVSDWVGNYADSVDDVLEHGKGTRADKSLLLQTMLEAVKIDAQLVWAADREQGQIDLEVANPGWFGNVLVRAAIDGELVFLDAGDPRLGFGRLADYNDGMPAVVHHKSKPELITLPSSEPTAHARRVELTLAVDEEGAVHGTGTLELGGHYVASYWRRTEEPEAEAWTEWLEESFTGFTIAEVSAEGDREAQTIRVGWTLRQAPDAVLGDEVSLPLSRPLGETGQRFPATPEERVTPVQFSFPGSRNEVVVHLSWPAGWRLDVEPEPASHSSVAGTFHSQLRLDAAERTLTYNRRLDRVGQLFAGRDQYGAVRQLYREAALHDAQELVLVRD